MTRSKSATVTFTDRNNVTATANVGANGDFVANLSGLRAGAITYAVTETNGSQTFTGVAGSFNSLLVDGATSTNDTVLLLASGASGHRDDVALADAVAAAPGFASSSVKSRPSAGATPSTR